MAKVAYRFLPCDKDGRPRQNGQYAMTLDAGEEPGIGSVLKADVFGYHAWEVVEIRRGRGPLSAAKDADGGLLPFGGTLICRGLG